MCLSMLHENMHCICGSLVTKRGRDDLFPSTLAVPLVTYTSMSSMNFLKLCKILADHGQCIQLCKEHNLLASSIKSPPENCSNTWTWTRRALSRDGYEWRCFRRNCTDMASMPTKTVYLGQESNLREWL